MIEALIAGLFVFAVLCVGMVWTPRHHKNTDKSECSEGVYGALPYMTIRAPLAAWAGFQTATIPHGCTHSRNTAQRNACVTPQQRYVCNSAGPGHGFRGVRAHMPAACALHLGGA
jgi:hypothetical protein